MAFAFPFSFNTVMLKMCLHTQLAPSPVFTLPGLVANSGADLAHLGTTKRGLAAGETRAAPALRSLSIFSPVSSCHSGH